MTRSPSVSPAAAAGARPSRISPHPTGMTSHSICATPPSATPSTRNTKTRPTSPAAPFIPQSGPALIQMFSRLPSLYWPFPARCSGPFSQPRERFAKGAVIINVAKGIELSTLRTGSSFIPEILADRDIMYAVLSGPSFAREVMHNRPTAVVIASRYAKVAETVRFPAHSSAAMPPQMFWALKSEARSRISLP